jgi:dTDP-4-dehydrorhamnose reductase
MAQSNLPGILVTGANGQLGRCLQKAAANMPGFTFHFLGREHLPIDNHLLTREVLHALKPVCVINAGAYTAVDKAESEQEMANNANGYAVGNLAKYCNESDAKFIHVSTDYVFDGKAKKPYLETDVTNPVNAYGASKLLGETLALQENPQSIIIRTSWVYSSYGSNFVKTMLRLMNERDVIRVVSDQFGSPTYAQDLADAILSMSVAKDGPKGIYHFSNQGVISWFDFACAIRDLAGLNCNVEPITTELFPTPAKRPEWSVMDCSKIEREWNIQLRPWRDALQEALKTF